VVLSGFQGNLFNWSSITEIKLEGERHTSTALPEPSCFILLGSVGAALLFHRTHRKA
jgi:hypothetical protein